MFQWVSKLLAGGSNALPPGVPAAWAAKLEKVLTPPESVRSQPGAADRATDAVRYVLHGEPVSVVAEIARTKQTRQQFGLDEQLRDSLQAQFYDEFDALPGEVALRWGLLLDGLLGGGAPSLQFPSGLRWPDALLAHATGRGLGYSMPNQGVPRGLTAAVFERALEAAGQPTSSFVTASFASPVAGQRWGAVLEFCPKVAGMGEAIARHADAVRPLLLPAAVPQRLHVLKLLDTAAPHTLALFAGELAELATSSSKQVRIAAEPLLRQTGAAAVEPLRRLAREGKPDQRVSALRLLWTISRGNGDETLRAELLEIAAADKAPTAQALLVEWQGANAEARPQPRFEYEVPVIAWGEAMSPAVERALQVMWDDIVHMIDRTNEEGRKWEAHQQARGYNHKWKDVKHVTAGDRDRLREYISSPRPQLTGKALLRQHGRAQQLAPIFERFATAEGVSPVVVVKVLAFFSELGEELGPYGAFTSVINAMHRAKGTPTLLELQKLLEPMDVPARQVLLAYCRSWHGLAREWSNEAVWPFFAENLDFLLEYLNPLATGSYWFDRDAVFDAISTLPAPPDSIVNRLFELALGTLKTERPRAERAVSKLPDKEPRIISALADGKSEVRAAAAGWLARLGHRPAIPALESALKKERNDIAKGALLDALEALGQPVERYLDRAALAADARKTVSKEVPKELAWMPWDSLPHVRWHDSGEELGSDVLRGLVIQAYKGKSPEPNAVLRKYCQMFEPRDREAFGQAVLEAWLSEDVRPIPPDEALQRARQHAASMHHWMQTSPQNFQQDPNFGKSVEEMTAGYLPAMLRVPAGSAAGSKGVLAIAAACCGERAASAVARYLKEYYGTRASQGKALIAMLAWIEHPSATQLMLSIGNRFRTKSFQEEATRQAEALAERKGWTLSELADRTIPSAGFDEMNELELSYGQRRFVARLLPDFKIELFNPDGKKIAALPEPRQDDDAEQAKNSKKALSAAKKEIKSIVEQQTDRLYESLCTARDWSFDDWQRYLQKHPVMRRLIQRLVWVETDADGTLIRTFRPLDDGTLTDVEDNEITLEPQARVRIAHESFLPDSLSAAWQAHLADYDVMPLFQQFGKGRYRLPDDKRPLDELTDFRGHLLEAFALRGRALKLGYTRGRAEDAGVFVTYEKRFPTLGITVTIEFTGNGLPEQNRTVALLSLYFCRAGGQETRGGKMPLSQVPGVLLSECYDDLRSIAAEGTGFDEEWEKKSGW